MHSSDDIADFPLERSIECVRCARVDFDSRLQKVNSVRHERFQDVG